MKNIFINKPILAISLSIIIVLLGVIAIFNLSIEQYPNITPPVVEVTASYTGADAQTVDNSVATPIAQSVMGVSDMLYMQSTSANDGSMTLQVTFEIGTDPDINTILTQSKLSEATATLPDAVTEQGVITQKTNDNFLMIYSLHSDQKNYDGLFLTNYAMLNIQDELLKIEGVSDVQILGAGDYAMRIWLDPQKMEYYSLNYTEIADAITTQASIYPAGSFGAEPLKEKVAKKYTVMLPPSFSSPEQFADIILSADQDGNIVRLQDIATVNLGSEIYDISSRYGSDPAALIIVYQGVGSNILEVGSKVKDKMEQLSKRMPNGLVYDTVVDSTISVKEGINDIFRTLIIALFLVIVIIFLFLQDWRATLIPLIAIPVSLIGAFILFPALGFTINIISLLALVLAIGLVVDDAIVVVEAVGVNLSQGMKPSEAAIEAMKKVSSPIIATTIVLLAVFIPISFIDGVSGMLYKQFSTVICFSVVLSAINALTLSPALCAILLKENTKGKTKEKNAFSKFNNWYSRYSNKYSSRIGILLKHSSRTAIFTLIMLGAIFCLWRTLPSGFLPQEDEGYVIIATALPENSPLDYTEQVMVKVNALVRSLPEIKESPYAAGFDMLANIAQSNSGVMFAQLVPYSDRKLSAEQIAAKLNEILYLEIPEAMCFAFIPPSIPGLGMASGVTLQVQDLEGRGTDYLYGQTLELMGALEKSGLTSQISTQYNQGVRQKLIDIDTEQASVLGVNLSEVYPTIGMMLGGSYLGNFNRFGRSYYIYMEAEPEFRRDDSAIENFYFKNTEGEKVALSSFATVRDTVGVNYVSGFNLYRSIGLTIIPKTKVSSSQIIEFIDRYSTPDDIGIAWSGVTYLQMAETSGQSMIYLFVLLFVFLVLSALYNSWSLPLSILFSVPIAVLGALTSSVIMHLFRSAYLNDVYMQISLIMLIGLSAKNAILVVEYAHDNFFKQNMSLEKAASQAATIRLRPILMTAFAFILGVLPLVFASGVYSTARNIMGIALVGGMALATLIGIYLYPSLFYIVGKLANFENLRNKAKQALLIGIVILSFSCSPKLTDANPSLPENYNFKDSILTRSNNSMLWWEASTDTLLRSLINQALAENKSLQATLTKVKQAQYSLKIAKAELLPSFDLDMSVERYREDEVQLSEYQLTPTASWQIPMWGKMRATKSGAKASLLYSQWAYRSSALTIASEVASAYYTLIEYQSCKKIAEKSYILRAKASALIDSMYCYGMSSKTTLKQAQSLENAAKQDMENYSKAINITRYSLAILLSKDSLQIQEINTPISALTEPEAIPNGLPSDLLHNRPDLMQSYYLMQQAASKVGIAHACQFPLISLSVDGGLFNYTLKDMTLQKLLTWQWAIDLVAPLFNFKKLRNEKKSAIEAYNASVLDYEQDILSALSDVEKALINISSTKHVILNSKDYMTDYQYISNATWSLYKGGMDSYLNVLDSQREYYSAQISYIGLICEQQINYVNLYTALGCHWKE